MTKPPLVVPPTAKLSKKDMDHAAEDARIVVEKSPIVRQLMVSMIASRRLYMLARSAMDNELANGWTLDNKELVSQTLSISAQEKANEKFLLVDVNKALLNNSVPFVDILIQQERESGQGIYTEEDSTDEPTEAVDPGPDEQILSGSNTEEEA